MRTMNRLGWVFLAVTVALGCARGGTPDAPYGDAALGDDGVGGDATVDAGTPCSTDENCSAAPEGTVCDTARGVCAGCVAGGTSCAAGDYCDTSTHACATGCDTDGDCGRVTHCDAARHRCVGCAADGDCVPGTVCAMGTCVPGCNDQQPCGVGHVCCANACVDTHADAMNCGACGNACDKGGACCAGACATVAGDTANCGRCGARCGAANGTPACAAGVCGVASCNTGFGDCNGRGDDGCESELASDPMNCGGCGRACPHGVNATTVCMAGTCAVTCMAGYGDCDGAPANGCENEFATNAANCGACGHRCPAGPNATATCAMAMCGITCDPGFADCDGDPSNGCEVFVATSAANCGGCGVRCMVPHASATCSAGACGVATCDTGFADCDGMAMNGCETNLGGDSTNCGACGHRCSLGTACSMGMCASVCSGGATFCADRCAALDTDVGNCGACGHACDAAANATAVCRSSACSLSCAAGFGDCDNAPADGCETNLRDSLANCGACGVACARANASAACTGAACSIAACNTGFGNCDGSDANGCEADLRSSTTNCGGCGQACSLPFATGTCAAGSCTIAACVPGYANCDGVTTNGCETNLATNNSSCGSCGQSCGPGTACSGGSCASVCTGGTTYCGGSCVDLTADGRNCGGCGNVCPGGQVCRASRCIVPGPANDTCAGAQVISLAASDVTVTGSNVGATPSITPPCGSGVTTDVFYRIDIPGPSREMVYADTIGSSFDTVLYFARDCATALTASTTAGDVICDDDLGGAGCSTFTLQSQAVALLTPGTWYVMVGGYGGTSGNINLRIQHLAVGGGTVTLLPAGSTTPSGATSGTGTLSGSCGGSPAGEATWWWRTCPEATGGAFSATTCGRASWDTLIYLRNAAGGGDACNDDNCGLQSTVNGSIPAGAGLHAFTVDGFYTNTGAFSVAVTRP